MAKKIKKSIKKQSAIKTPSKFGLSNITVTIMIVILAMIFVVEMAMFTYSKQSIKDLQNELSTDFISNLQVFKQFVSSNRQDYFNFQKELNAVLSGSYIVQFTVVTDKKTQKQVYSNLPANSEYIFRNPNNPASFKLVKYFGGQNLNYIRTVFLDTPNNYYYIGVYQSDSITEYHEKITSFVIIFSLLIIIIALIVAYMLAQTITKPLKEMEKTVGNIANGDLSGRLDYAQYQELNTLANSYNMMADALQRMYSTLENQVQERTRELKSAYSELQSTQAMMVHSEKMKSLGELVAGIMHEINNPINFIYGNMTHLGNYSNDLIDMIDEYNKHLDKLPEDIQASLEKYREEIDFDFLKTDMPDLIKSCKEGADRAKNIIQDLKSFSRMEEAAITDVNVPQEIDTTLNILHNKIKNKANVHKEYMENVPKIEAFGGQLNQVFMNILDNAVGAIEKQGDIWIRINTENNKMLRIEIEDNGVGMEEEVIKKVFDPFFTTKPVGQGTGLGMSITHKIVKNHQGSISVESNKGIGTKFTIKLPINIDRENLKAGALSEGETNGKV